MLWSPLTNDCGNSSCSWRWVKSKPVLMPSAPPGRSARSREPRTLTNVRSLLDVDWAFGATCDRTAAELVPPTW